MTTWGVARLRCPDPTPTRGVVRLAQPRSVRVTLCVWISRSKRLQAGERVWLAPPPPKSITGEISYLQPPPPGRLTTSQGVYLVICISYLRPGANTWGRSATNCERKTCGLDYITVTEQDSPGISAYDMVRARFSQEGPEATSMGGTLGSPVLTRGRGATTPQGAQSKVGPMTG